MFPMPGLIIAGQALESIDYVMTVEKWFGSNERGYDYTLGYGAISPTRVFKDWNYETILGTHHDPANFYWGLFDIAVPNSEDTFVYITVEGEFETMAGVPAGPQTYTFYRRDATVLRQSGETRWLWSATMTHRFVIGNDYDLKVWVRSGY